MPRTQNRDPAELERASMVIEGVAWVTSFTVDELRKRPNGVNRELARARRAAIYLIRDSTELSYPVIGELFDVTKWGALHACQSVDKDMNRPSGWSTRALIEFVQSWMEDPARCQATA